MLPPIEPVGKVQDPNIPWGGSVAMEPEDFKHDEPLTPKTRRGSARLPEDIYRVGRHKQELKLHEHSGKYQGYEVPGGSIRGLLAKDTLAEEVALDWARQLKWERDQKRESRPQSVLMAGIAWGRNRIYRVTENGHLSQCQATRSCEECGGYHESLYCAGEDRKETRVPRGQPDLTCERYEYRYLRPDMRTDEGVYEVRLWDVRLS